MASRDHAQTITAVTSGKPHTPSHTPGPWQSRDDYTLDGFLTIIANVDGEYVDGRAVCTYETVAFCGDEYGETQPNAAANAQLIIAAPELLTGAIALIAAAWNHDAIRNTAAMRDLRAAVQRATGGCAEGVAASVDGQVPGRTK